MIFPLSLFKAKIDIAQGQHPSLPSHRVNIPRCPRTGSHSPCWLCTGWTSNMLTSHRVNIPYANLAQQKHPWRCPCTGSHFPCWPCTGSTFLILTSHRVNIPHATITQGQHPPRCARTGSTSTMLTSHRVNIPHAKLRQGQHSPCWPHTGSTSPWDLPLADLALVQHIQCRLFNPGQYPPLSTLCRVNINLWEP